MSHQAPGSYGQQVNASRPSASPAPALNHQSSYGSHTSAHQTPGPQTPQYTPSTSHNTNFAGYSTAASHLATAPAHIITPNPLASYDAAAYRTSSTSLPHSSRPAIPAPTGSAHTNAYNPPRPFEVYQLSDAANASIPADVRAQFHCDEHDRILFFTAPPLDVPRVPLAQKKLGHSLKYLAAKARDAEKKSESPAAAALAHSTPGVKHGLDQDDAISRQANEIKKLKVKAMETLGAQMDQGTDELYRSLYGKDWQGVKQAQRAHLAQLQEEERKKKKLLSIHDKEALERKKVVLNRW